MPFLIYAIDHPDRAALREAHREEHREHHRKAGNKILAAGALLADDGKTVIGGITLLDVKTKEEAETFMRNDPYSRIGIRKETRVIRWRKRWWNGQFLGDAD